MSLAPPPKTSLPKRIWRVIWRALSVISLILPCLVVLFILALDLPIARRQIAREVTDILATTFAGHVIIEHIGHIGITGLGGVRVRVEDPSGTQVLLVDDVSATIAIVSTLRSVLQKDGDMVIDVTSIEIAGAFANLDTDESGELRVARAFGPKDPNAPKSEGGRATVAHLRKILLAHAWVHGQPSPGQFIDADIDHVDLSLIVGGKDTIADLAALDLTARHLADGIDARAHVEAHVAMPAPSGGEQAGRADVHGDIAGVAFRARGSIDGKRVAGAIDIAQITPQNAAQLAPGLELSHPLSLHAEAEGTLPELHAKLKARIAASNVDIVANATLNDAKRIHLELDARDIDAHAFASAAPPTRITATSTVDVTIRENGAIEGSYALDALAGVAASQTTPPLRFRGKIDSAPAKGGTTAIAITGEGTLAEPGAPTDLRFAFRIPGNEISTVNAEITTRVADLANTRLGGAFRGSATLEAKAVVTLAKATRVAATANLALLRVGASDQRIERGRLHAEVRGTVDAPTIDAVFAGTDLTVGAMKFAEATIAVRGTTASANVDVSLRPTGGPRIEAKAAVGIQNGVSIDRARVKVQRDDVLAVLEVESVRIEGSTLRADGASLEGLGEPAHFEVAKTAREFSIKGQSAGLDLAKLARLLRTTAAPSPSDFRGGRLAFDVDLVAKNGGAKGHAKLDLEEAAFARVKNGTVHFKADIAGRRIDTTLHANLGEAAHADIESGRIEFDADKPLDLALLETARGNIAMDARVDIGQMKAFFPRGTLPFTDMRGILRLKADMARASTTDVPELHVTAATRGLLLSGRGDEERVDGSRVLATPPWQIEGVDVEFGTTLLGDSGATALAMRLFDKCGTIVALDARSPSLPFRDWIRGQPIDVQALADAKVTADVVIPRRELKQFPAIVRTQQTAGSVVARIHVDGSLANPDVHLQGQAAAIVLPYPKDLPPFDAKIAARYKDREGNVTVGILSAGKELLTVTSKFEGALPIAAGADSTPWTADTKVQIQAFPLAMLSTVTDVPVRGFVSGEASVTGLHRDARANLQLTLHNVGLGRARFPRGEARVDFDGKALHARARLDQTDGFLEAESEVGLRWGSEIAPAVVTSQPAFATVKADQFRIAALLPFTRSILAGLDGRLRTDARVDLMPGADPKIRADVSIEKGRVQLVRLGETLQDVTMRVKATPDGLVRLEQLSARGSRGRLDVKAVARMKGFALVSANANLHIPENDPFPLDIDGQEIGDLDGDVEIAADASDNRTLKVDVKIPRLHIELPLASSNTPQALEDAPKIRVGYFRRRRQFVLLPLAAPEDPADDETTKVSTTTQIAIHLGEHLEIERGNSIRLTVAGDPRVEITDKARVSGQIRLTRGFIEVQGKRFEVEKGTVTFVGDDPGNPQIVVTAGWDAPDGTRVYADFVGPLKTGTVRLRSEPSRPQNEILALIMFGAAEGSSSTPYPSRQPDGTTRAGAMAGGFATEGLTKGLDQLTGLDVSAKIDTSNSANPRPEIEVQIARDIAVQIAYVMGVPPPGTNPDRTFLTVDWRFRRNWSMDTTFGDQGSSMLDLMWRYRY